MNISIIAAMARNRVIGKDNRMPWHLPAELQYFKSVTMGKPIVMGRHTFESIGRVLPGRQNIVLTRNEAYRFPGVDVVHTVEDAVDVAAGTEELMIIGGGRLYKQMLPRADKLYLTLIDANIKGDTQFPEIDYAQWVEIRRTKRASDDKNPYSMTFLELGKAPNCTDISCHGEVS